MFKRWKLSFFKDNLKAEQICEKFDLNFEKIDTFDAYVSGKEQEFERFLDACFSEEPEFFVIGIKLEY